MRTAYRCRAYPDEAQQRMLARTFGCIRVVWNRTLAERRRLYQAEGTSLCYAASDAALTKMKKDPALAFLARAIGCSGWAEFRAMLEYKAQRFDRRIAVVDRWYPSSKTCSRCGYLLTGLSLGTRHWACPSCGARHDRDVNAAQNILAAGLAAGARDGADAWGGTVRRAGATRTRVPVKQET
jgi:transposase